MTGLAPRRSMGREGRHNISLQPMAEVKSLTPLLLVTQEEPGSGTGRLRSYPGCQSNVKPSAKHFTENIFQRINLNTEKLGWCISRAFTLTDSCSGSARYSVCMLQKEQGKSNPAVNPSVYNADLTCLYGM